MILSALAILLIETYYPDAHKKYLCMNYMQSNQYRKYKSIVPEYLQDRPRSTILHCLERKSKSCKYTTDDVSATDITLGIFEINKSESKTYTVSFGFDANDKMPYCTCPDWIKWHIPCKHFFTVFRLYPSWDWYKLPQKYLESAYLSTDQESLNNFFKQSIGTSEDVASFVALGNDVNPDSDHSNCTSDVNGLDGQEDDAIPVLTTIPKHQVHSMFINNYLFTNFYRVILYC